MTPTEVSSALVEATQSISSLLLAAKKNSENLSDFVESGLGPSLGPAIGVIAKLLKDLQIGARQSGFSVEMSKSNNIRFLGKV